VTALNPNNTRRYFLNYSTSAAAHTMMLRTTTAVNAFSASFIFNDIFTAWASDLSLVTVNSMEMAEKGTNVRNPVLYSGAATFGAAAEVGNLAPRQICFLGRSTDGRRARLFLFGYKGATPTDWRFTVADHAAVGTVYNLLNSNPGVFLSISELATVKYNYADVNFNSYWERELRH
jgi:hypothetical protein